MYQLVTNFLILLTMALTEAEEVPVSKGERGKSKCTAKFDCIVLSGFCVTNAALCEGRLEPSWCKGKQCQCCIPVNQCVLEDGANSVLWHKMDMSEKAIKDFTKKGFNNVTGLMEIKIDSLEQKIEVLEKKLNDANLKVENELQSIKENQEITHAKLNLLLNNTTSPTPSTCPICPGVTSEPSPTKPGVTSGPSTNETDGVIFKFVNRCTQDLWMGGEGRSNSKPSFVFNGLNFYVPNNGGWYLPAGDSSQVTVPLDFTAGRFWARTGCTGTINHDFHCETGDCGPWIECATNNVPRGGAPPVTLAEMTLNAQNGDGTHQDYFDISLVDGFNLPMTIHVVTYDDSQVNPDKDYWCKSPECLYDINSICPSELAVTGASGTVACNSACMKFDTAEYCCRPPCCGLPSTCTADKWPVDYPNEVFKAHCPQAYSFAYDDETSTFHCRDTNYEIYFC